MAKSVNKVILIGNLGKDPEIKYTPGGMPVARLTLATNERFKDKEGNWQDRTEWHNLVTVYIEGSLRTNSWDDKESGQKKYRTEIIVNDLVLLGGGQREGGESGGGYSGGRSAGKASGGGGSYDQRTPDDSPVASSSGAPDITDEDIPF